MMQPLRSTLTDTLYPYTTLLRFYYEQISDVTRDKKITEQANAALGEVIRRYPGSRYAADARLKMDLVQDHLAGKEMEIGRYYERSSSWLAASLRFREVVDKFQTTSHTPEALYRLVECYLALGRSEEHTPELQSLMRISYAVFCLKKNNNNPAT